jgi:hypothetical protein
MHRPAARLALSSSVLLACMAPAEELSPESTLVLGPENRSLSDDAPALEAGRYGEGICLTRAGLELPNNPLDEAAALDNRAAAYLGKPAKA